MIRHRSIYGIILNLFLWSSHAVTHPPTDFAMALELYQRTEYQQVIRMLEPKLENNAAAYGLIGKSYYRLGNYKKASQELEKAIELDPSNSDYFDWLGKVYGNRAETSSIFTALPYAVK